MLPSVGKVVLLGGIDIYSFIISSRVLVAFCLSGLVNNESIKKHHLRLPHVDEISIRSTVQFTERWATECSDTAEHEWDFVLRYALGFRHFGHDRTKQYDLLV